MKDWPAVLFAAWALASSSLASESKDSPTPDAEAERQVLDLDRAWADAETKHDVATLRRILDDRFVATFGAGKLYDKEGFIKAVIPDETDTTLSQDLTDRTVRVDRDTAVIIETDTVRGTDAGKAYTHIYRITTVYIRRDSRWVALAEHIVQAPLAK